MRNLTFSLLLTLALAAAAKECFRTRVDGLKQEGRAFHKDRSLAGKLLAKLRQELKADGGFTLPELNPQELDLLWSLWGFDELKGSQTALGYTPRCAYFYVFCS